MLFSWWHWHELILLFFLKPDISIKSTSIKEMCQFYNLVKNTQISTILNTFSRQKYSYFQYNWSISPTVNLDQVKLSQDMPQVNLGQVKSSHDRSSQVETGKFGNVLGPKCFLTKIVLWTQYFLDQKFFRTQKFFLNQSFLN